MAGMASQIPSPLGFRQRLTGPIDIKKSGLLPIENLARFWAFSRAVTAGTTVERLVAVGDSSSAPGQHAQALQEAFASMGMVRLRHHAKLIEQGRTPHNVIDTARLRPLVRVSLQEALRAVAAAQKLLP